MTDWLDGWERRHEGDAGPLNADAPRCLLLHTMETSSFEGGMNTLTNRGVWPQLAYDQRNRRKVQAIPLGRAGKALANKAGGVETNRWGVIQVETPGFAAQSHDWPDEHLRNIAEDVVVPLVKLELIELVAPRFVGQESGWIARADAPQRFSFDAWRKFHGICGHQHAPENDHWDPGRLNVPRIIEHARELLGGEEDDMKGLLVKTEGHAAVFVLSVGAGTIAWVKNGETLGSLTWLHGLGLQDTEIHEVSRKFLDGLALVGPKPPLW